MPCGAVPSARSLTLCTTSAGATAATCKGARAVMNDYQAPLADMKFVLRELPDHELLAQLPGFGDLTPDVAGAVLDEAAKFAFKSSCLVTRSEHLEGGR